MNDNLSGPNQTVPTTIGALLTEECTIDPLSHFPSFLELTFVDVARNSGRKALSAAWGVGIAWLEGMLERLRRLERLADRMASRLYDYDGGSSSSVFRLWRVLRAITIQLGRVRVRILRRLCHAFLGTVKTLGPELQALIMYAIDYNCMHYLAGATACEMVYGLKRSKVVGAVSLTLPPKLHGVDKTTQSEEKNSHRMDQNRENYQQHEQRVVDLTNFDKTCSALLANLLPYWKDRCDRFYSEWKEQSTSISGSSPLYHAPINARTRRANRGTFENSKETFLQLYPYFHMAHEGSIFLYQFAYLMGFTHYWSFSLHGLGVILRRMTVADMEQQQQQKQLQRHQEQSPSHRQKDGVMSSPKPTQARQHRTNAIPSAKNLALGTKLSAPKLLRGALLFSVSYTLLSGWYSHFQRQLRMRRRRWIAGDEDERNEGETNTEGESRRQPQLPIPPPPLPPNVLNEDDEIIDKWSCPICKEPRINPTASTSGYVFCYKCLVTHLRQKGNYCPVTGMPCWENKVVRLYEPTASSRRGAVGGTKKGTNR